MPEAGCPDSQSEGLTTSRNNGIKIPLPRDYGACSLNTSIVSQVARLGLWLPSQALAVGFCPASEWSLPFDHHQSPVLGTVQGGQPMLCLGAGRGQDCLRARTVMDPGNRLSSLQDFGSAFLATATESHFTL